MAETSYIGKFLYGRYRVLHRMGSGGSARVYAAHDVLMNRQVALKILSDDETDLRLNSRSFETEVNAIAMLSHKNIVTVYDVSVENNLKYIVMELVDGITLRDLLDHADGPMPVSEVIAGAKQILDALQEAHGKGLVHRDIKPQNIMVMKSGQIKVADFGIARLPGSDQFRFKGRAVGTVHYISPEQATSGRVDARSDLYSLGVVMYEMLTGKLPFDGDDVSSVAMKQVTDTPVAPRLLRSEIPRALEAVVLRAMEKDPDRRYESAADMKEALEHVMKNADKEVKRGVFAGLRGLFGRKETPAVQTEEMNALQAAEQTQTEEEMKVILDRDKLNRKRDFSRHQADESIKTEETASPTDEQMTEMSKEAVADEPIAEIASIEEETPAEEEAVADEPIAEIAFIEEEALTEEEAVADEPMAEIASIEEETPAEEEAVADEPIAEIASIEEEALTEEEAVEEKTEEQKNTTEEIVADESSDDETVIFHVCERKKDGLEAPFEENNDPTRLTDSVTEMPTKPQADSTATVAFGAVQEPIRYTPTVEDDREEDENTASAEKKWRIATGVLSAALAVTLIFSAWYSGFPFGTKVPELDTYRGEKTISGMPVSVDYVVSDEPSGTVLTQVPSAGYTRHADALYLRVSSGTSPYAAPNVKATMDDALIGNSVDEAYAILNGYAENNPAAPLHALRVLEDSHEVPEGHVIRYELTYTPVPGRENGVGDTTVILYISAGEEN